jgi:hypothetical protein
MPCRCMPRSPWHHSAGGRGRAARPPVQVCGKPCDQLPCHTARRQCGTHPPPLSHTHTCCLRHRRSPQVSPRCLDPCRARSVPGPHCAEPHAERQRRRQHQRVGLRQLGAPEAAQGPQGQRQQRHGARQRPPRPQLSKVRGWVGLCACWVGARGGGQAASDLRGAPCGAPRSI